MPGRLTAHALAFLALLAAGPVPVRAAEPSVDCIEIPTRAPNNPLVKFWYRVPSSYDPSRREHHRVLVLFGGRNADGRPEVSGKLGWTAWAVHGCGVFPEPPPRVGAPALVSCGVGDGDRFTLGRTFACRYREAGGLLVWKPTRGGHAPDAAALGLARAFFAAVASGAPCARWGEDDTRRLAPREAIDPEYLNPLYDDRLADLWRRDAP